MVRSRTLEYQGQNLALLLTSGMDLGSYAASVYASVKWE